MVSWQHMIRPCQNNRDIARMLSVQGEGDVPFAGGAAGPIARTDPPRQNTGRLRPDVVLDDLIVSTNGGLPALCRTHAPSVPNLIDGD
ncbi:hypothetical protein GCM10009765_35200 [Fodinicola feengrottensis]|uniref:Uncharacterized protein n=1 Tax=Fodinicola feengrottensis TaxID=435914 RepID=A0ABN2H7Q1_9ACTN